MVEKVFGSEVRLYIVRIHNYTVALQAGVFLGGFLYI